MENLVEPLQFIKEIHDKGVKYLLIGRQAVIAYGGPVQSMDYDIFIDGAKENTRKLLDIAKNYGLYPSRKIEKLENTFMFKLENDFVVDVFRSRHFTSSNGKKISFDDIYLRRNTVKGASGLEVNLPSIDDLIELKKLRNSPKDIQDIKYLEEIKENKHT
jgi:hypothetical protein